MKTSFLPHFLLCISGTALVLAASSQAGSFVTDFNSGLPANSAVFGVSAVSPNDGTGGGITNSGCLQLMTDVGSQAGSFIINELDPGVAVRSFTANFQMFIGSFGAGADGMALSFGPDIPDGTFGEQGAGTGLTVSFDTYANPGEVCSRINVYSGGVQQTTNIFPGIRPGQFVQTVVQLNPDNTLTVMYDGVYVYSNLDLTASGYAPAAGSRFGFGSRTGGTSDNVWIDNLSITTRTNAAAFVQSFSPRGRRVAPSNAIDIVLTDSTTHVNTNTVVLKLDGATVSPVITANGSGDTLLHFVPASNFAPFSAHSVRVSFADDATPTANTTTFEYQFSIPAQNFTILFQDGFETRNLGGLDADLVGGPNENENGNLPGNPWFGPFPTNLRVVNTENTTVPHTGTNMVRGLGGNVADFDQEYYNLAYRLNNGNVFRNNLRLDWWFYDPLGPGGTGFADYMALNHYGSFNSTADWVPDTSAVGRPGSNASLDQRLSLGATTFNGNSTYDANVYQARVVGATDSPGITNTSGWFNTTSPRSVGWHHGRVIIGGLQPQSAPEVTFYIDDMVTPTLTHNGMTSSGYNFIEVNAQFATQTGYFDDISFSVANAPSLSHTVSGSNLVLSWPGGFTLESATDVTGPYTTVLNPANSRAATSPFTYDMNGNPTQFFRLAH